MAHTAEKIEGKIRVSRSWICEIRILQNIKWFNHWLYSAL